jgi:hypothetical protein
MKISEAKRCVTLAALGIGALLMSATSGGCSAQSTGEVTGENAGHGGAGKPVTVDEGSRANPRGTYIIVDGNAQPSPSEGKAFKTDSAAAPAHRTIYVNGKGATITAANNDDSSRQQSSIINGTIRIPPYGGGSAQWSTFMTCIKDEFARWNVTVTDQDPGALPHLEAMIGGSAGNAGFGQGVGGVSPMTGDCSLIESAIVYIFSAAFGEDPTTSCEVAAQELGHAIGMDHEYYCQDPMTYLQGCGHKTFQDKSVSCGENGPRTCSCGSSTQNSVQFMNARLGPSSGNPPPPPPPPPPGDSTPPTIAAISPANGATLAANTTISLSATITDPDDAVASAVLVWEYNGQTLNFDCNNPPSGFTCSHSGGTYTWSLSVGSGPRAFTITATDSSGNKTTSARQTLTLGSGNPPPPPPPPNGPTVAFDSPSAGATVSPGGTIDVRVTATDASASISSVSLRWHSPSGDQLYDLSSVGGNDWGRSLQLSSAAVSGPRTLRVTVTDSNSQRASTADLSIQVQ